MVASTCLYPHTLIFEKFDFRRLLQTVQALLSCTADQVSHGSSGVMHLHFSQDSFDTIPDLVEELGRGKIAFGYIFTPEA